MKKNLKIFYWNEFNIQDKEKILSRPILHNLTVLQDQVKKIILDVKMLGDKALYNYTHVFDKIRLNQIKVSKSSILNSELHIEKTVKHAIKTSFENIKRFHSLQSVKDIDLKVNKDIFCQQIIRPIKSVGLYVPGGSAPLVSTVLMLVVPAMVSGCKKIVLCSPPPISKEILYASKICGIQEIFQIGGAQAIAALGCGTNTIPKVDKIFGPGNAFVTEAKRQVSQMFYNVGIDMLAGPSEVLIIADKNANFEFIASDLLSQMEHDNYSQAILVTYDQRLAKNVLNEISKQIKSLPRYKIIMQALKNSKIIITQDLYQCFEVSNLYAPEHLMIQCEHAQDFLKYVISAGSIFLGNWSPVAVGDYAIGTNHVLPTYGSANVYSGLSLIDFQKRISVQKLNQKGLKDISSTVLSLSTVEQLDAHKNSVKIRLSLPSNEI